MIVPVPAGDGTRRSTRLPTALVFLGTALLLAPITGCGDKTSDDPKSTGSSTTKPAPAASSNTSTPDTARSAGGPSGPAPAAPYRPEQVTSLVEAGRYREAADIVAREGDRAGAPKKAELLARAADLYHRSETFDLALRRAREAVDAGDSNLRTRYIIGDCLREQKQPSEAEPVLAGVLKDDPSHFESALSLARVRFRSGKTEEAFELFKSFFDQAPGDHPLRDIGQLELARAMLRAKRAQEAADLLVMLIEKTPSERTYLSELSRALYRLKLRDQGKFVEERYRALSERAFEEHVEKGLLSSGRVGIGLAQRALVRAMNRRYGEAFSSFQNALRADPDDTRIAIYFADLCLEFHRPSDALAALQAVESRRPRILSGVHQARGKVLLAKRSYDQAVSSFARAIKLLGTEGDQGGPVQGQASVPDCSLGLARAFVELDRLQEAVKALSGVVVNAEVELLSGRVALEDDNLRDAMPPLQRAIKITEGRAKSEVIAWSLVTQLTIAGPEKVAAELEGQPLDPHQIVTCERLLADVAIDGSVRDAVTQRLSALRKAKAELDALYQRVDSTPLAQSAGVYTELADHYAKLGDADAFKFMLLASDLDPNNVEVIRKLLSALRSKNDFFVRMKLLRQLVEKDPNDLASRRELADRYVRLHVRLDESFRLIEQVHRARPDAVSYEVLVNVLATRGQTTEAKMVLHEALGKYPENPRLARLQSRLQ